MTAQSLKKLKELKCIPAKRKARMILQNILSCAAQVRELGFPADSILSSNLSEAISEIEILTRRS